MSFFFVNEFTFGENTAYRGLVSADAANGGFRAVGTFASFGLLAAIDGEGRSLWQKTYTIAGRTVRFWSGVRCDDGDLMIHGSLVVSIDRNEALILRMSPTGNVRWAKTYTRDRTLSNIRLIRGRGDTYIFAGWYNESRETDDVEVVRIDGAGKVLAAVNIHTAADDQLTSLIPYEDGCCLVGGTAAGNTSDCFLITLDGALRPGIRQAIGDANFQQAIDIIQLEHGLSHLPIFALVGETGDLRKTFMATWSPGDDEIVANVYDFRPGPEHGSKRLFQSRGNVYLAANLQAPLASRVARFDAGMTLQWQKTLALPGSTFLSDIGNAGDGGVALCGVVVGDGPMTRSLFVYADAELASCVTRPIDLPPVTTARFRVTEWPAVVTDVKMTVTAQTVAVQKVVPAVKEFCPAQPEIDTADASLQSPYVLLQAAGSDFSDQTVRGFHLRWDLLGSLGRNHLPKGNLAAPGAAWATTIGYNRADDFVRIYKTELDVDFGVDVEFDSAPTTLFESGSVREWLYEDLVSIPGRTTDVSIRFVDIAQYDALRTSIDPALTPLDFIRDYNGVLEVRAIGKLAFLARFQLTGVGGAKTGLMRVEAVTQADRLNNQSRRVGCRRTWTLSSDPEVVCENIESLRFDYSGLMPIALHIATYEDFFYGAAKRRLWQKVGQYSLDDGNSDANANVFQRLEAPPAVVVDHQWPKFQRFTTPGLARVEAKNYRDRWTMLGGLKNGVITYLDASRTDVQANVVVPNSDPIPNTSSMELSYLDLLNFVSLDHHVARMLGLGTIDANATVAPTQRFIYLMQYVTEGQLEHETPRRLLHCYMTTPAGITDYRLPPPAALSLTYGLPPEECGGATSPLTDANGYALFDRARFINLERAPFRHEQPMESFFQTPDEFCLCEESVPVAFGIQYGAGPVGAGNDVQPELSHNADWQDPSGIAEVSMIPDRGSNPVYTHRETDGGVHHYRLYTINWFSRTGNLSNEVQTDDTQFAPRNSLLPPSSFAVQLIQPEEPLLLTTALEQLRRKGLPPGDQTLVRVTFDWNWVQNRAYHLADTVELFFRTEQAAVVRGEVASISVDTTAHTVTVTTRNYTITSTDPVQNVQPDIPALDAQRFIGGFFNAGGQSWLIRSVATTGLNPTLVLEQIRTTKSIAANLNNSFCTVESWISPAVNDRFLIAENLNQESVWDPRLAKEVSLTQFSPPYSEIIVNEDGTSRTEILGGLADSALVTDIPDPDPNIGSFVPAVGPLSVPTGAYRVVFSAQQLSPIVDPDVEFHEGVIRMRAKDGKMKVLRVWSIDTSKPTLVLVVYDGEFGLERDPVTHQFVLDNANQFVPVQGYVPIDVGNVSIVNFHPSYRIYLTADVDAVQHRNFGEGAILPSKNEGRRQTLMTARSRDSRPTTMLTSSMAKPAVLLALELHEPQAPSAPIGPLYATRPNFYGKSTYTLDVEVDEPHSLVFYKANERKILDQLYAPDTARAIMAALESPSETEKTFTAQRWHDLVHGVTGADDEYLQHVPDGFRFRIPDNTDYAIPNPRPDAILVHPFDGTIPPGSSAIVTGTNPPRTMRDVVREAIEGAFIPLTEQPLVYRQIRSDTMQTSGRPPKPQVDPWPMAIRYEKNAAGNVLQSLDAGYGDPANTRWVRITDYTLDGAATNIYFYFGVELTDTLKVSERSGLAGPVLLVNSMPPVAPAIRDVRIREADPAFNIPTAIVVSVNPYLPAEGVERCSLYRALDAQAAQSVRSMTLVTTAAAGEELVDDFRDLDIPFGDPLYYRVVAMRGFTDEQGQHQLAPSWPSDVRIAKMVDDVVPPAPELTFTFGTPIPGPPVLFPDVKLTWSRTAWKPRYHLFKMNPLGNWVKVHTLVTNDLLVTLDLADTDLQTNVLAKENAAGQTIYHRFKVVTESSGGLLSREERAIVI